MVQTVDVGYTLVGPTESFGAEGHDFWLVETDSAGHMEWSRTHGGGDHDWGVFCSSDQRWRIRNVRSDTRSIGAGGWDGWLTKLVPPKIPATIDIDPNTRAKLKLFFA